MFDILIGENSESQDDTRQSLTAVIGEGLFSHNVHETCKMEYETEMKPRDLHQELGRLSSLGYQERSDSKDSSLSLTIDK